MGITKRKQTLYGKRIAIKSIRKEIEINFLKHNNKELYLTITGI